MIAACAGLLSTPLLAAPPTVTKVSPPALVVGTTHVIVEGANLAADLKLVLPVTIGEQKLAGTPAGNKIEFDVTLAADVAAGLYPLRVTTADGISPAVVIAVDKIPTVPFAATIDSRPIALYGDVPGAQVFVEVGPKDVLTGLMKRIDGSKTTFNLNSVENLKTFVGD